MRECVFVYVESVGEAQAIRNAFRKRYNPGIGGTTFQQLSLLNELHKYLEKSIDVVGLADDFISLEPYHCSLFKFNTIKELGKVEGTHRTLIINAGGLNRYYEDISLLEDARVIIWLHHPFDHKTIAMGRSINASFVSCGKYQFLSNWLLGAHDHFHIYNFYYSEDILRQSISSAFPKTRKAIGEFRIGYWGALHPSKGFHHVARSWNTISRDLMINSNLNATLFVIGKEYGFSPGERSSVIPTTLDYAKTIIGCFDCNGEIPPNVSFLGSLPSPHAIIRDFDLIITNPAGTGEAFSQVVLEIFSLRVPAVISTRYGMSDFASCVPELSINHPSQLASAVLHYTKLSESRKKEIIDKQFNYAETISLSRYDSINRWGSILTHHGIRRNRTLLSILFDVNLLTLMQDVALELLLQLRRRFKSRLS